MKLNPLIARHRCRAPHVLVESLEGRRLLSAAVPLAAQSAASQATFAPMAAPAQPSITGTSPANGATGVPLDASISTNLNLPNSGLDPATVIPANVQLYPTSTSVPVSATVTTSAAGDSILLQPNAFLAPDTQYTFVVTSGVKDTTGASMTPFTMSFTTGTTASTADPSLKFEQVALPTATGAQFTDVKVGPDHRLYASTQDGRIFRWTTNADGTLGTPQIITSLQDANGGNRLITGFDFDPRSSYTSPTLWVAHGYYSTLDAPDWTGKITVMSGPDLQAVQDAVVNLPRSIRDHLTEQPSFGPDGALYIPQASNTSFGAPDSTWGMRPEHMLNAAILRLDVSKITPGQPLDAMTVDAGGPYNPLASGAPLTIYASGVRNAFSLLWTHDGVLYAPNNGSSSGGNAPASPDGAVPAIDNVSVNEEDYLYQIVPGGYYGHPNSTIGHYVLDGGNPTSGGGSDVIPQYPAGTQPDPAYKGFVFDFGPHPSPNGIIEYQDYSFGGKLQNAILVSEYGQGNDIIALTRANGTITGQRGITGFEFLQNPISLAEDPTNGNIYVSEIGAQKLTLLKPPALTPAQQVAADRFVLGSVQQRRAAQLTLARQTIQTDQKSYSQALRTLHQAQTAAKRAHQPPTSVDPSLQAQVQRLLANIRSDRSALTSFQKADFTGVTPARKKLTSDLIAQRRSQRHH